MHKATLTPDHKVTLTPIRKVTLPPIYKVTLTPICKVTLKALLEPARRPKERAGRPAGSLGEDARTRSKVVKKRIVGEGAPRRMLPAPASPEIP